MPVIEHISGIEHMPGLEHMPVIEQKNSVTWGKQLK